jgi:hypothetical protein
VRSTGLESCAVDLIVQKAIDALARRDWRLLKTLLHPYLQWTDTHAGAHVPTPPGWKPVAPQEGSDQTAN